MTPQIQGQQFNPDEEKILNATIEHWRTVWNEAPLQAIARVEDAAKQMIVITAGLQGLYIALFVFSTIRAQVMVNPGGGLGVLILILFCTPVACWSVSLFYATQVFVPRMRLDVNFNEVSTGAWLKVKDAYGQGSKEKLHSLYLSHRWLVASFVLVLLSIVVLVSLPPVPVEPIRIIIVTPTPTP